METLATRLQAARHTKGVSLSTAAAAIGTSRSYLHALERGVSVPTVDKLQTVAAYYAIPVGALLGEAPATDAPARAAYIALVNLLAALTHPAASPQEQGVAVARAVTQGQAVAASLVPRWGYALAEAQDHSQG